MRVKVLLTLLVVLGAVVALGARGEEPISYQAQLEPIFVAECGDCHGASRPKKGLDLSLGKGYATLVDRPANEIPELLLVKAGDPGASYLWQKLTHTASEGKGMPRTIFSAKKLPDEQLDLVKRWIEEGARP